MGSTLALIANGCETGAGMQLAAMAALVPPRGPVFSQHIEHGVALGVQAIGCEAALAVNGEWAVAAHGFVTEPAACAGRDAGESAGKIGATLSATGVSALGSLRGEFAIVALDRRTGRLFAVRDPLGLKPLFMAEGPGGRAFAAEPRQVLGCAGKPAILDEEILIERLLTRIAPVDRSFFVGVEPLAPGFVHQFGPGSQVRPAKAAAAWSPPPARKRTQPEVALAEELRAVLATAVRQAVPASTHGVALSGGLDSGTVWALSSMMAGSGTANAGAPKGFSLVYPGFECDESALIGQLLRRYGAQSSLVDASTFRFAEHLGSLSQAVDTVPWPTLGNLGLLLQRAVAESCGVVLTGIGGDDWLAGNYRHMFEDLVTGRVARAVSDAFRAELPGELSRMELVMADVLSPRVGLGSLVKRARPPAWLHASRHDQWAAGFLPGGRASAWSGSLPRTVMLSTIHAYQAGADLVGLEQLSSHYGVELRHPLMSTGVVDFALSVGARALTGGRIWKHLLRRAMADALPTEILTRRDRALLDDFLAADRSAVIDACRRSPWILAEARVLDRGWLDRVIGAAYTLNSRDFCDLGQLLCAEVFSERVAGIDTGRYGGGA